MPALQTVVLDGFAVAYRQAGTGPPLLLLHGAYEDSRIWARVLGELARDFTVIALDVPGHGGSDDPPDSWTADDYADTVVGLLRALGVDVVTVVGLSFGSVLALELYARRPEVVERLVLAAAYAGWAGSLPKEEVAARMAQVLAELDRPVSELAPTWLPTLLTAAATQEMRDEVTAIMADAHPAGMRVALSVFGANDLRPVLPTIAVPTLLVYGECDGRSPASPVGEAMHAAIPGSRLVVVPGAPHLLMIEAAAELAAAIRAFMR